MQDVAERAEVVKSAAYYYFPARKRLSRRTTRRCRRNRSGSATEVFAGSKDLRVRLKAAMGTKLDLAQDDRRLLGVVFRYTGEPEHPLSLPGAGNGWRCGGGPSRFFEKAIAEEKLAGGPGASCCRWRCGRCRWGCW